MLIVLEGSVRLSLGCMLHSMRLSTTLCSGWPSLVYTLSDMRLELVAGQDAKVKSTNVEIKILMAGHFVDHGGSLYSDSLWQLGCF